MFDFLFGGRAKAVMRTKIIAIYLDNYIRLGDGTQVDDWGNNWKEKSLNDVIKFFRDKETNPTYITKLDLNTLGSVPSNSNDINPALIFSILHRTYFDKDPSANVIKALDKEYQNELVIRGLNI